MTSRLSKLDVGLRQVGDLDDEFYDDEYQRDVWNEASAVGFQAYQLCLLAAAAVLPWAAGRVGAWIALGLLICWVVVGGAVQGYAKRRGVDVRLLVKWGSPRVIAVTAVYAVGVIGVFYRLMWNSDVGADYGTLLGGLVGAACGGGAALWAARRVKRDRLAREREEERREAASWDDRDR
ncbi:DUF2029 domain-containing protein [Tomitella gaofuii]|uniref:DUF2029 domain-containing protein n=1 Tax=Tomitella gaofuii TaxID=2760083 RepID=UPI001F46611F|nr:DUF2029 domain-containing protein [Tomitella gaofuii]